MDTRRLPFLDADIFLRHIVGDDPNHSPRATAYFERIERGELTVRTADTVVFETVFTLLSFYKVPREQIREKLLPLLLLPGLHLPRSTPTGRCSHSMSAVPDSPLPTAIMWCWYGG